MSELVSPLNNDPPSTERATSWTLIHAAADGSATALDHFAKRYERIVRSCLVTRWRNSWRIGMLDDAVQEVFVECIRPGGALSKASSNFPGGFRAYLFGVTRNVMRRYESKPLPGPEIVQDIIADEATVGGIFDREYARSIVKEASEHQRETAKIKGEEFLQRVELLHLRFYEGLPIREIANRWSTDAAWLHRQYAKAREEFLTALMEVVAASQPTASYAENQSTCRELLALL